MSKDKKLKPKKKREVLMMPNLSGLKFEDVVKAMLQTPPPKKKRKS